MSPGPCGRLGHEHDSAFSCLLAHKIPTHRKTGEGKKGYSNWGKRERERGESNRIEPGEASETGRRAAESAPAAGMEDLSVEELASNLSTYKEQLREVSSPPLPTLSSIWLRPLSVLAAILPEWSF